jgi:short-subunit dehydrogenase
VSGPAVAGRREAAGARGPLDLRGRLVVVTGASSGLGREIARQLACVEGADIVVAARRRERLEELKADVEGSSSARVHIVTADLCDPREVESLHRWATAHGEVFGLVNCAGITYYGRALEAPTGTSERILSVNLFAGMRLTMLFLADFLERGRGFILTVTSLAGLIVTPFQTVYSASKHGMQAFMDGLAREYAGRGVRFATFVPGGIATEMLTLSGLDRRIAVTSPVNMGPARAARLAVDALKRGRRRCVPGPLNKTVAFLSRLVPGPLVTRLADLVYDPARARGAP